MGLKDILIRLRGMLGNPERKGTPMSPDEKELQVYMERERKVKIKKLVHQYRMREERDYLQGHNMLSEPHTLKDANWNKSRVKLKKRRGLLNQKGCLFK